MKTIMKHFATVAVASAMSLAVAQSATAGGDIRTGGGDIRDDYRPALWQGAYIGGHIGGTFGEIEVDGDSLDVDGIVGGVHLGYNIQNGNAVFGIEGDFSFTGAEIEDTDVEQDYLASIRGRLGYAMNNTLLYATAGIAWTQFSLDDEEETLTGYVIGAGAEYKYSKKISLRGEVLHYGFDEEIDGDDVEIDSTVIRAGVTWQVN